MSGNNSTSALPRKKPFTTFEVGLQAHVQEFLVFKFGNPVILPERHFLSSLIKKYLVKGDAVKPVEKTGFKTASIGISEHVFYKHGFCMPEAGQMVINEILDEFIKESVINMANCMFEQSITHEDWKKRYEKLNRDYDLLTQVVNNKLSLDSKRKVKQLNAAINRRKKENAEHRLKVDNALMYAAYDYMGISEDSWKFDAIQRMYYRRKGYTGTL